MRVCGVSLTASPRRLSADTQCKTTAMADIVLLVDGSWSIGRINFKTIRNFIARMVSVFDISPERVQIGNVFTPQLLLLYVVLLYTKPLYCNVAMLHYKCLPKFVRILLCSSLCSILTLCLVYLLYALWLDCLNLFELKQFIIFYGFVTCYLDL